jgi:hypothetical protein
MANPSICVEFHGQNYCITDCLVKVVRLQEERYEDVNGPASVVSGLTGAESALDTFTFWQRVPDTEPKYQYYLKREPPAVLPIKGFDHWWNKQVGTTRNMIRKSQKGARLASFLRR